MEKCSVFNKRGFPTTFSDACVQYILLQKKSKAVKDRNVNVLTNDYPKIHHKMNTFDFRDGFKRKDEFLSNGQPSLRQLWDLKK